MRTSSTRLAMVISGERGTADDDVAAVVPVTELTRSGLSRGQLRAALDAGRWQRAGRAVVLHNGPITPAQRLRVALVNCGPRSIVTGLTALEQLGLTGWPPPVIDVLAPPGVLGASVPGIKIRLQTTRRPLAVEVMGGRRLHKVEPATLHAIELIERPRTVCGLLAAVAQQRIAPATDLARTVEDRSRIRHRGLILATLHDIEMGAQALSEIDFVRLCRRYGLPTPHQQAVRTEPGGRRRYLDALWRRADGRAVAAEVDGALHMSRRQWWADQQRQNEVVLSGVMVLRFPSAVVRTEPKSVADQLRRALLGTDRQ